MKLTIRIFLVIILAVALILCSVFVFFSIRGKDLIVRELQNATQKKVSIDYFALHLPSEITLGNIDINGLARVRSVVIRPNIIECLTGRLVFDKIALQGLEFTYVKAGSAPESIFQPAEDFRKKMPFARGIFIKNLDSASGKVDFIDRSVGSGGLELRLDELSFSFHNLTFFAHSVVTKFTLKAEIPWHEGQGKGSVEAKGWFDLGKKDMEATLKVADIDAVYLSPYYAGWLNLDNARIDKARFDFNSAIQGEDNNLTALCHLELKDIVFKPRSPKEELKKEERAVNTVIGAFKAMDNGKMFVDFVVSTRMDRPEFGLANIKAAVKDKMTQARQANRLTVQKAALLPGKVFGGTVKGTTDITRALIGGTLSLGKELKKAFEIAFQKER
ncbi:MAG: DUF748 domain-containing protein [Candidatus Omnitrophica bacterium]|nr:DUF748 domain-containing protein [Candidatus Omnitrophota bacterium]